MDDLKFTTAEQFVSAQKSGMTPQEIFELKTQWLLESFDIKVDLKDEQKAIEWCEQNCELWQWDMERWDHPSHHLLSFENEVDAKDFENYMKGNDYE